MLIFLILLFTINDAVGDKSILNEALGKNKQIFENSFCCHEYILLTLLLFEIEEHGKTIKPI